MAPDGRIWNQQTGYSTDPDEKERFFVYNSRGEGGLMIGKIEKRPEGVNRYPDSRGFGANRGETVKGIWYDYDHCDLGSVSGRAVTLTGIPCGATPGRRPASPGGASSAVRTTRRARKCAGAVTDGSELRPSRP